MRILIFCFLQVLICFVSINSFSQSIYNDSIENGTNFSKAAFRVRIADTTRQVKGIIVLVPGSGYDGRNDIDNKEWQTLSKDLNFALMACFFKDNPHEHPEIEEYVNVRNGSGEAMLRSIKRIATSSRHKELDTIPFMMFGMSAGGQFNYEFACWAPERVQAFVVNKGGIYYTALAPPASWNIPGLFITGEKDSPYRTNIVKGIFSINRRFGAKWTYAQEFEAEHVIGKSEFLSQTFFREVIKRNNNQLNKNDTSYIGLVDKKLLIINETGRNMFSDLTSWIVSKQFGNDWIDFIGK